MDVSVVVATFGDPLWEHQGLKTAIHAQDHHPSEVVRVHGASLHEARNEGARRATSEWLCFLDADDRLDPGYFTAMASAEHEGDLLSPYVRYVGRSRSRSRPHQLPQRPLAERNCLIIGTLVRKSMFDQVGGFEDWPFWEDWAFWLRCHKAGATVAHVPDAVYAATFNQRGRNFVVDKSVAADMLRRIPSTILGGDL